MITIEDAKAIYLKVTDGTEVNDNYVTTKEFPAKCRRTIHQGGAVYGVLTRDDKEQLDRIEAMLIQLKGYIDFD
jgi:hypothetical protein